MFRFATVIAVLLSLVGARPVDAATAVDEPADAVCRDAEGATAGCPVAAIAAVRAVIIRAATPAAALPPARPDAPLRPFRHHREGGGGARAP